MRAESVSTAYGESLPGPREFVYIQRPIRIEMSRDVDFSTDQVTFRVVMRDDGMPMHSATHKDVRNFEASEFVTLAARA